MRKSCCHAPPSPVAARTFARCAERSSGCTIAKPRTLLSNLSPCGKPNSSSMVSEALTASVAGSQTQKAMWAARRAAASRSSVTRNASSTLARSPRVFCKSASVRRSASPARACSASVRSSQQSCEFSVLSHHPEDVCLVGEHRVGLCPIVCGAHECQEGSEDFEPRLSECAGHGPSCALRTGGLNEHDGEGVEHIALKLCFRIGNLERARTTLQPLEATRKSVGVRKWPAQQRECLLDRLREHRGISGGAPFADEETQMSDDAVTHLAESRQMNEEPLFKQRGERTVEVSGFGELPQFLYQSVCARRRAKEVREYTKSGSHFVGKRLVDRRRFPVDKVGFVHRSSTRFQS